MRVLTIAGFVTLASLAVVLYLAGRAHRLGLAPLGEVAEEIRSSATVRFALAIGWAWVGWHLLAR
jgi:hypothetical protein